MLWSALILGLLGSFHCIGMCGPIAFLLPVDRTNNSKKNLQILSYHSGRLFAYGLIGLVFGFIGSSFNIFGIQQSLSIIIGAIMILIVLVPSKIFIKYNLSRPIYKIISKVKTQLGQALKKKSADTFLTIGFLNGFLPCGLVYMAVFGAIASSNALDGSIYMVVFGLGTVPLMTSAIYFGSFITNNIKRRIRKIVPVFVVIIGFLFILRGMGLGIPYVSPKPISETINSNYDCPVDAQELINS